MGHIPLPADARLNWMHSNLGSSLGSRYQRMADAKLTIADDVITQLAARSWPGNIRELRNYLARLSLSAINNNIHIVDSTQAPAGGRLHDHIPSGKRRCPALAHHRGSGVLKVPIQGSLTLFIIGAVVYQFSVTALGILLATFTTSMAQFGLLGMAVPVIMNLLSRSTTPMESMPVWLQNVMELSPARHFVGFSQAALYRGAGLAIVLPQLVAMAAISAVFFVISLLRFRKAIVSIQYSIQ